MSCIPFWKPYNNRKNGNRVKLPNHDAYHKQCLHLLHHKATFFNYKNWSNFMLSYAECTSTLYYWKWEALLLACNYKYQPIAFVQLSSLSKSLLWIPILAFSLHFFPTFQLLAYQEDRDLWIWVDSTTLPLWLLFSSFQVRTKQTPSNQFLNLLMNEWMTRYWF